MKIVNTAIQAILLLAFCSAVMAKPPERVDDVVEHLEFIGYEVVLDSSKATAKHPQKYSIFLRDYHGGILVTMNAYPKDDGKNNRDKILELMNKLNRRALATRYYVDDSNTMFVEGYYPGEYSKQSFSIFMDAFNQVGKELSEDLEQLQKYFK